MASPVTTTAEKSSNMADVVVTVPKTFEFAGKKGLAAWVAEGDLPGEPFSGSESFYTTWGPMPDMKVGDRVYVVCEGKVRGYAPLTKLFFHDRSNGQGYVEFVREGGAVAVTIPEPVTGFRGWRYRWWSKETEIPFPDWRTS